MKKKVHKKNEDIKKKSRKRNTSKDLNIKKRVLKKNKHK
jgi:hypothetical protein